MGGIDSFEAFLDPLTVEVETFIKNPRSFSSVSFSHRAILLIKKSTFEVIFGRKCESICISLDVSRLDTRIKVNRTILPSPICLQVV